MPDPGLDPSQRETLARIRQAAGLKDGEGPSDERLLAGINGFVESFDFRYIKVIREAVKKYRPLIIGRVNPLVRKMQLQGLSAADVAARLVNDWAARNFVTAGGFAIEELAIGVGDNVEKSSTEGIDLQEHTTEVDGSLTYDLYVLKSGPVTRNSDILSALKRNSKKAEKLLRQNKSVKAVMAHYAIATGKTSSSFEDGVNRPSSEELWAKITGLDKTRAVDLIVAMATEAGALVEQDAAEMLEGLRRLVQAYIEHPDQPGTVDWDWIVSRTMRDRKTWAKEDRDRHKRALEVMAQEQAALSEVATMAATAPEVDDEDPPGIDAGGPPTS